MIRIPKIMLGDDNDGDSARHLEVIKAYIIASCTIVVCIIACVTVAFIFVDSGVYGCLCMYNNISSLFSVYILYIEL